MNYWTKDDDSPVFAGRCYPGLGSLIDPPMQETLDYQAGMLGLGPSPMADHNTPVAVQEWVTTTSSDGTSAIEPVRMTAGWVDVNRDGTAVVPQHSAVLNTYITPNLAEKEELDRLKEQVEQLATQLQQAIKNNQLRLAESSEPKNAERKLVID